MSTVEWTSTRYLFTRDATAARLDFNGDRFGFIIEDVDRGLNQFDDLADIEAVKVRGLTAIPAGRYRIGLRDSPKHGKDTLYLIDVPGFEYIDIHPGNTAADTMGCQCPALYIDEEKMSTSGSKNACRWFYEQTRNFVKIGGEAYFTIKRQGLPLDLDGDGLPGVTPKRKKG